MEQSVWMSLPVARPIVHILPNSPVSHSRRSQTKQESAPNGGRDVRSNHGSPPWGFGGFYASHYNTPYATDV